MERVLQEGEKIKDNKPLLEKILKTLELWSVTFKYIGTPNETPRYSQLMFEYDNERFVLKSTQKNLWYEIEGMTDEENDFLDNMEHNDRWQQYKDIRTEYLLANHPTISAYKDGGNTLGFNYTIGGL